MTTITQLDPIETASRDELQALQTQRLKWTLKHAYENVPMYRRKFDAAGIHPDDFHELSDLSKFPCTTKQDLRDNYPFDTFAVPMEQVVRIHASSGTTGKPTVVGYTQNDIDNWANIVHQLADSFTKNGIEDKSSFLDKVEEYAEIFFKLYVEDQKNPQQSSQQGSQQQNGQQGSQQQSGQQGPQQQSGQQGSQQQSGQWGVGRPKDGDEHGNAFVFADPDKVKEAIEVLAEETSVEEFIDLLAIAGIIGMSDKQKGVLWFNVQSANIIPIVEFSNTGNKSSYTYPSVWRIGDPIEELDLMLTYMTSPRLIPGMTTKKWGYVSNDDNGTESKQMDLLLVVDTSGSMGSAMKESANMHQAVLASYGILSYFESTKSKVAFIGFSDKIDAYVDWSDKYDDVRERLLTNGHGGTKFPISRIKSTLDVRSRDLVTVLITNGDLGNINESVSYFRDYLNDDNKLYIFLLGGSKSLHSYEPLKNIGAKIYNANNANEFCDMVLTDME